MNFIIILLPVFLLSIVQVVYAQDLSESLNSAINNELQDTFDSVTNNIDNTDNTQIGSNIETDSVDTATPSNTTTTINLDQQQQQQSTPPQLNLIIQEQGKITNQRVLEVHPYPKIESTFVANLTMLGNISAHDLGTYSANMYPNGFVHGEGQGITTTSDGEILTWTGEGAGKMSPEGDVRFEGSLFFHTSSQGQLSYLNNKVGFFVFEVDKEGNTLANVWEFK